jgi:RES domain-containing protein
VLGSAFRPRGAAARWNSEGTVVVYTAEHPALAALEILNGWEMYARLSGYHLYRCAFDAAGVLETPPDLDVRDQEATRAFGDAWVQARGSLALKVPSVAVPDAYNYLLNPNHPDFADQVTLEPLGPFAEGTRVEKLVRDAKS